MSQVVSKIKVLTGGTFPAINVATSAVKVSVNPGNTQRVKSVFPDANVSTGGVKVSVNPGNTQKVQSINYLGTPSDVVIAEAMDVEFLNTANNNSVLTYDVTIQKFVVQNIPRINGGTF